MGNACQRHTLPFNLTPSTSKTVHPKGSEDRSATSRASSPSASSGRVGNNGDDVDRGDGITSMTVEHSSTSGGPTSLTSLGSDVQKANSPIARTRFDDLSKVSPSSSRGNLDLRLDHYPEISSGPSSPYGASPLPTALSTSSLEPAAQHQLRDFYVRNLRAQKRHATMMEQQRLSLSCETSSTSTERVDLYDVFSPDERSTRWSEFQELLANSHNEYKSYKNTTQNVRGSGKAMTIAGVRPNPNPAGQFPIMH